LTIDNETLLLVTAFHDEELSPSEALLMQTRINNEPELAALARAFGQLSSGLAEVLPGGAAPDRLRSAIFASLPVDLTRDDVDGEKKRRSTQLPPLAPMSAIHATNWRSMAAALAIGLAVGGAGGSYYAYVAADGRQIATIEKEVLAAHLRGLIAPQPFDLASSENHVVKPWYNGKTTIAPTAPDFAAQGFRLAGGRVDVIGGRAVPTMVYTRRQHIISVTVTTVDDSKAAATSVSDGTNVRRWTSGDLTYWAVSDLNPSELSTFAELYQRALDGTK